MKNLHNYLIEKLKLSDVKAVGKEEKNFLYCRDHINIDNDIDDADALITANGYKRIDWDFFPQRHLAVSVYNQSGKDKNLKWAIVFITDARSRLYVGVETRHIYRIEFYDENGKLIDSIGDEKYDTCNDDISYKFKWIKEIRNK